MRKYVHIAAAGAPRAAPRQLSRREVLNWAVMGAGAAAVGAGDALAYDGASLPMPAAIRGQNYRLVQNWDFATTITDAAALREAFHTRYIYANGTLDTLNDEWQRYRDNGNHVIRDGVLALVARVPGELAPGKVESGMLRSKWSGKYGYFECRMKVPSGRGMWPAFWLNPQDMTWPPEIDIVEIVDNGRDSTANSFHFVHGREAKQASVRFSLLGADQSYRPGFDYAGSFHTFAAEWTPRGVRHWVDDVLVVDREFAWRHDDGRDGGPVHVLLNLAVGGKWPGPPLSRDGFPARLEVAHIRVWQMEAGA
jgi:beta-glucanase (GH16 family)